MLARSFKDLFPRYRSMCGYSVERKGGWDTHGLPVELEVEKSLHISGKKQIEEFGVARFNDLCRASVAKYIDEWEAMTERLGFWIDMDDPYRTYDGTYIESVWWSLKQLWDRDLLYQDYKVTPYCPRCQTSLSSHELSQGYQDDVPDPSVYVKFRLTGGDDVSLLAWTTTPWTLPGNVALAVHPDAAYVEVEQGGERLILARARLEVLDGDYTVIRELRGSDLVGRTYEPLFTDMLPEGKAFLVLAAPGLVSMEEGTGIVHTAAAYGEADLELCRGRASRCATWSASTGASSRGRPAIAVSSSRTPTRGSSPTSRPRAASTSRARSATPTPSAGAATPRCSTTRSPPGSSGPRR